MDVAAGVVQGCKADFGEGVGCPVGEAGFGGGSLGHWGDGGLGGGRHGGGV